jgi:hypothetical protein
VDADLLRDAMREVGKTLRTLARVSRTFLALFLKLSAIETISVA